MQKTLPPLIILASLLVPALQATPAHALPPTKVWISGNGSDGSVGCPANAPCATLNHAFSVVAAGGEIAVAGPGEFGSLLVTKAVSISNDGAGEALIQSNSTAIDILANPGDILTLRGLVIDGMGVGLNGVRLDGALTALHMQNCVIKNFEGSGNQFGTWAINYAPSVTSHIFISDTLIYNNGSTANTGGILIEGQGGNGVTAVLDRVHIENNVLGLKVDNQFSTGFGSTVVVRDSVLTGNASNAITASVPSGLPGALLLVERATIVSNAGTGILASGVHANVLLSDSTISRNGTGVSAVGGGQLISYGNNRNNNNFGAEGTATSTFAPF